MNMKCISKFFTIFSLAAALSVGGLTFRSTISGAEVETPDQLKMDLYSQVSGQRAAEQQEPSSSLASDVNREIQNSNTQQGTSTISDTNAGTVSTNSNGTAVLEKVENKKKVSLNTVTVNGTVYNITTIGSGSLKDAADVKTIELGEEIERIEKKAFSGADNLKKIKVTGAKAFRVEKGAFGKLDTSKVKVIVSDKMSDKEYKKLQVRMRNAGFKGTFSRGE